MKTLRFVAVGILLLLPWQLGAWNITSPGAGASIDRFAPVSGTGGADASGINYTWELWAGGTVQVSSNPGVSGGPPGTATWSNQLLPTVGSPAQWTTGAYEVRLVPGSGTAPAPNNITIV